MIVFVHRVGLLHPTRNDAPMTCRHDFIMMLALGMFWRVDGSTEFWSHSNRLEHWIEKHCTIQATPENYIAVTQSGSSSGPYLSSEAAKEPLPSYQAFGCTDINDPPHLISWQE